MKAASHEARETAAAVLPVSDEEMEQEHDQKKVYQEAKRLAHARTKLMKLNKQQSREVSTLAQIRNLRTPKPQKAPAVRPPAVFHSTILTETKAQAKSKLPWLAEHHLQKLDREYNDLVDQTEKQAEALSFAPTSDDLPQMHTLADKDDELDHFFKDKTWMLGATESYGGWLEKLPHHAVRDARRAIRDFAQSDTEESSAMTGYTLANVKRVNMGKNPTVFDQETVVPEHHVHAILKPRFRFMRGVFRGDSAAKVYEQHRRREALRKVNKIAGIKRNGDFYDQDGWSTALSTSHVTAVED